MRQTMWNVGCPCTFASGETEAPGSRLIVLTLPTIQSERKDALTLGQGIKNTVENFCGQRRAEFTGPPRSAAAQLVEKKFYQKNRNRNQHNTLLNLPNSPDMHSFALCRLSRSSLMRSSLMRSSLSVSARGISTSKIADTPKAAIAEALGEYS